MKQQTSFGTSFEVGVEQHDALRMQSNKNHTLKKGEMMNFSFESDDTTAIPGSTSTPERGSHSNNEITNTDNQDYENDEEEDVTNESDANDTDDAIEDEIDTWLNSIRTDIKSLAMTLRSTAGGVAHFVHRSAVTVVNEIKSLDHIDDDGDVEVDESNMGGEDEDDVDERRFNEIDDNSEAPNDPEELDTTNIEFSWDKYPFFGSIKSSGKLLLPWESQNSNNVVDHGTAPSCMINHDATLQERIFLISHHEENFVTPKRSYSDDNVTNHDFFSVCDMFPVQALIQKLLKYDPQLLYVHSKHQFDTNRTTDTKIMMNDDEKNFWYNYFHACTVVRNQYFSETAVDATSTQLQIDDVRIPIEPDVTLPRENIETTNVISTSAAMPSDCIKDAEAESSPNGVPDGDDDDNSYICLSESDDHSPLTKIPPAPYSSGMKSIDSMVFVEDVSPTSAANTTTSPVPTTVTQKTKNIATNFLNMFS